MLLSALVLLGSAAAAQAPDGADAASSRAPQEPIASGRPYLGAAREAGRWIVAHRVEEAHGWSWPVAPGADERRAAHLYSGSPGVVLFLLDLYRATGEAEWADAARAGAKHLAATLPEALPEGSDGLYVGIGGTGFVLSRAWRVLGDAELRAGAVACAELLHDGAQREGDGVWWSETVDLVAGGAGSGLFLLDAAITLDRPQDRALAIAAGRRLLLLATTEDAGLRWKMRPSDPRDLPNFSHGTGGVAYFFACLYEATGEKEFLDAARSGARHLVSLAAPEDDRFLVPHHFPGGEDLFYLGWCHGPVGTSRLFRKLAAVSGETEWRDGLERCVHAIAASGIPTERTPGFWNNEGICCGTAGLVPFHLALGELDRARHAGDTLVAAAAREETGWSWTHAEHRVRPEFVQAQTGWMQGAAGIGAALLRLDARLHGGPEPTWLPDEPECRLAPHELEANGVEPGGD